MPPQQWEAIFWCSAVSLMALGYGEYTSRRQAMGQPITPKERCRNLLILFGVAVGLAAFPFLHLDAGISQFITVRELRVIATTAATPILLWYSFVVPLRITRHLSRTRQRRGTAIHPLDGAWSPDVSFLDRINLDRAKRNHPTRVVEPTNGHPLPGSSPPLDNSGSAA